MATAQRSIEDRYDTDDYIRQLQQEIVRLKQRLKKLEERVEDDGK